MIFGNRISFYGELWNLWLLVDEIQVERMLIPRLKINGIGWLSFSHVIKFHSCILVAVWWRLEVTYIGVVHG